MTRRPFEYLPIPHPRSKPRSSGLTFIIDWGHPIGRVRDALDLVGPFFDIVKIAVATARLYPERYLRAKLEAYAGHAIKPFIGGLFGEWVYSNHGMAGMRPYYEEAGRLGFEAVEVSDNRVPLSHDERRTLIALAIDCGHEVYAEVGSAATVHRSEDLVEQALVAFEAGCRLVIFEAAELVDGSGPSTEVVDGVKRNLDLSRCVFELPGPWLPDTTATDVIRLREYLIHTFGPEVNLGNVALEDVMETELQRTGLSVKAPQGSFG